MWCSLKSVRKITLFPLFGSRKVSGSGSPNSAAQVLFCLLSDFPPAVPTSTLISSNSLPTQQLTNHWCQWRLLGGKHIQPRRTVRWRDPPNFHSLLTLAKEGRRDLSRVLVWTCLILIASDRYSTSNRERKLCVKYLGHLRHISGMFGYEAPTTSLAGGPPLSDQVFLPPTPNLWSLSKLLQSTVHTFIYIPRARPNDHSLNRWLKKTHLSSSSPDWPSSLLAVRGGSKNRPERKLLFVYFSP